MKLFQQINSNSLKCLLCPHFCILKEDQVGKCRARENSNGKIQLVNYGLVSCIAVEPIEKKPFKHFLPGSKTLSFGNWGCSLHCVHCENYKISQNIPTNISNIYSPQKIIDMAIEKDCNVVCMTYNEPTIAYEYLIDLAKMCPSNNLKFVIKTNAYVNPLPWTIICENIDAVNIDWKGCLGTFEKIARVRKTYNIFSRIKDAYIMGVHVEISVPIYSGELRRDELAIFGSTIGEIDRNIPCHLLRISPSYDMENDLFTTKEEILQSKAILSHYLSNIYI